MTCTLPEPEPPPTSISQSAAIIHRIAAESTILHQYTREYAVTDDNVNTCDEILTSASTPNAQALLNGQPENSTILPSPVTHQLLQEEATHNRLTTIRLLRSASQHPGASMPMQLHIDGGANRSVTNCRDVLLHYRNIKPFHIQGVNADDLALVCQGFGYLPWRAPNGTSILVRCYYSQAAADTIVSPTDIVLNHLARFKAWTQHSDLSSGTGHIEFHGATTSDPSLRFPLTAVNGLWYYYPDVSDYNPNTECVQYQSIVNRLSAPGQYELYHARLGHPGTTVMTSLHKHADGIPKLTVPPLFRCEACMRTKATKRAVTAAAHGQTCRPSAVTDDVMIPDDTTDSFTPDEPTVLPGAYFHMDMGFVRGSQFSYEDEEGRIVTSLDGYNSYLIIVDRATRYTWVILTKAKTPQVDLVSKFLAVHGNKTATQRFIRTDEGGELWGSHLFQQMCKESGFILQPTASDASFQNGVAERPNRSYGDMMRSMLYDARLGPEYWSWALLHAVYLKNRLPHRAIGVTPYKAYTGKKPDLKHLRIFGCPVVNRLPGRRPAKLDSHTSSGTFLGFTATSHNIYYRDHETKRIKIATHVSFDEAGYTVPQSALTPTQRSLQRWNMPLTSEMAATPTVETPSDSLQVQLLTSKATIPTRGTVDSAGLDLYSAAELTVPPGVPTAVATDIAVRPPPGTYCQILSRSGMMLNYRVEAKAGVIDRDYTGNIQVILLNHSDIPYIIKQGDKIAQLVTYYIAQPTPEVTSHLTATDRGPNGFGSTDKPKELPGHLIPVPYVCQLQVYPSAQAPPSVDTAHSQVDSTTAITEAIEATDGIKPYNIWLCTDPFQHRVKIQLEIKGTHPTLGLLTQGCQATNRIQLVDMAPGTPGIRLPRWRSTLKRSLILSVDGQSVTTPTALTEAITAARAKGQQHCTIEFAEATGITHHPTEGSLHLYYDQLNVIADHLRQYRSMATAAGDDRPIIHLAQAPPPPDEELGQSYTWRQIKQRPDLPEWKSKRYKMLNDYHQQSMFSEPMERPLNANVHHMLWRYVIKQDGTKKARMVCDGSPRQGTITLGHTHANSLMAASERMFWALTAMNNLIAYGADVTNAFAEAPPPVAPLYMYIDDAYREWWTEHLGNPPIPPHLTVVQVQNAIQGHPESPRLWEKHIDRILRNVGFRPTRHEPCLYRTTIDGKMVLFLRQVDDFAIAAPNGSMVDDILKQINDKLRMPMKNLGIITRFNGVDIEQTKSYIKLHCAKYLTTMLNKHGWVTTAASQSVSPTPFHTDRNTLRNLQECTPPITQQAKMELQTKMGFSYRQLMGEIMYPMVKCRPDISPHAILLSQFMDNPGEAHYLALKEVALFLAHTIQDGIHYWRPVPHPDLPFAPDPTTQPDNYTLQETRGYNSITLIGYVDSDWAANIKKRTSLTGAVIMMAGGVIGYKTKFQTVIAHSSTEAEFVAACDTAKMILFFRSLLSDLGMPQESSTILFEDNTGALLMANAQQPTKRTRHMDIKHFALLDWVEQDLLKLERISTHDNTADAMTKPLTRQLFHRHRDTYMGHRIPDYVRSIKQGKHTGTCSTLTALPSMGGV
jgi:deoxyuridine 5'-triphosphate nucleotidohydrolase